LIFRQPSRVASDGGSKRQSCGDTTAAARTGRSGWILPDDLHPPGPLAPSKSAETRRGPARLMAGRIPVTFPSGPAARALAARSCGACVECGLAWPGGPDRA